MTQTEELIVPDHYEVSQSIPRWFRDNGPSVPVIFVLFRGIIAAFAAEFIATWYRVARPHDFGYSFGQLPGSPWEHVTKEGWDEMLRRGMAEYDHSRFGKWAKKFLQNKISDYHWRKGLRDLHAKGWYTYAQAVAAKEAEQAARWRADS